MGRPLPYLLLLLTLALAAAGCSDPVVAPADGALDDAGNAEIDACASGCVTDPCDTVHCTDPRQVCVSTAGAAECRCPAGTHDEAGHCVDDLACSATTCGVGGSCSDTGGTITCACSDGYTGDRCESCATGYLRDPSGLCDANLCDPNPCTDVDRSVCVVESDVAVCHCNAGTHDESGTCVPDATCMSDTCSTRGTCSDTSTGPTCACDAGFDGQHCELCDETGGYHADGLGGCTMDPCLPDPCTTAPFTRCVATTGGTSCACPTGTHADGGGCTIDETCTASSCGGHGACDATSGVVSCTCDVGYAAPLCTSCDAGYHDDGAGGCTDDVCVPSPCTMPNRSVCTAGASGAVCSCDAGYHDDGVGNCTTDPCLPHPCGAQACRVMAGAAECYTPMCDDGNPCTTDTPGPTGCTYAMLPNGSACSTSVCFTGRTCSAGVCGGGASVSCDDANPCTTDSCDAVTGCAHDVDATATPSDGIACTTDSCAGGTPTHVASNAACDDGLWCTGVESCSPSASGADANGCVHGSVPQPPAAAGPCAPVGACSEATHSFPVTPLAAGTSCSDGIACTTGDVCATTGGACVGTVTTSCLPTSCSSTTPWTSYLDIPTASVAGRITLDGAVPPTMVESDGYGVLSLWLVAQDTHVRHLAGQLRYTNYVSGGYTRSASDDTIDLRIVPGVYDVLLDRDVTTSSTGSGDRWVGSTLGATPLPSAWRTLRTGLVIGPGANTITLDVPTAHVTGTITLAGATPPIMTSNDGYGVASLWLVAQDTHVRHLAGQLRYTNYVSGGYTRSASDDQIDITLAPGTYDLLYDRDVTTSSTASGDRWVGSTLSATAIPSGWRTLRTGIVIPAGASTLALDVPNATVTGSITLDGAVPPTMVGNDGYGVGSVWAVAQDTHARHLVGQLRYTNYVSGGYTRSATDDHIDVDLVPGTYDLLFDRDVTTSSTGSRDRWVGSTLGATPIPSSWRVLRTGVVIPAGASTLDVDVPTATVTGHVTLDGAVPPTMVGNDGYGVGSVWAIATDTHARHLVAQLRYTNYVSGGYTRSATDDQIDVRLVPGTYDLLFERDVTTSSTASGDRWVGSTLSATPIPSGWRILRTGVVVPAGASTLDVDIPTARVTGTITLAGAVPPTMVGNDGYGVGSLWAIATDTGVRHLVGQLRYTNYVSGGYTRSATDDQIDLRILPGTYDLLFDRDVTTSSTGSGDRWVGSTLGATPIPSGWRILRTGVVVGSGASTLTVDIPSSALGGNITLDAITPPIMVGNDGYGVGSVWAISRDTGVRHLLGQLRYTNYVSGGYTRSAMDDLVNVRVLPGTYDILFDRDVTTSSTASGDRWVGSTLGGTPVPSGWRILRSCVQVN